MLLALARGAGSGAAEGSGASAPTAPPVRGEFSGLLTYTAGEYRMVLYALMATGLALLAGSLHAFATRGETGPRYRAASDASALLQLVAFLAYVELFVSWKTSFTLRGERYVPVADTEFDGGMRYADWSVTVPLLAVELLAVCAVTGRRMSVLRGTAVAASFLMILAGFLGAQVLDNGNRVLWLVVWAAVSTVFFLVLYAVLGHAVLAGRDELSPEAYTVLKRATVLLFGAFGVYPLIYLIQQSVGPGSPLVAWALVTQLGFCAADVAAKTWFGVLIHKVAKVRTADDVRAGTGTHAEEVWVSHVKRADAWPPVAAALTGHGARPASLPAHDGHYGGHGRDGTGRDR
ncbi:bacteriorhodopsin [Streptomyces sp. NPDC052701]|uniref:bacteriorhodopsin n=1 Tax=Streptomyces sp. NPDC052701 TaxID=3155533 RepID=UPI00342D0FB7